MSQDLLSAGRYARAFVELAHKSGELQSSLEGLANVSEVIESHAELAEVLENPEISVQQKEKLLKKLLAKKIPEQTLKLVVLLLWKGRLNLLSDVLTAAQSLRDEVEGIARGTVRSAKAVPEDLLEELKNAFAERFEKEVVLETEIDKRLIGGVQVTLENQIFDGSIRRGLHTLKEQLLKA